MNYKQIALVLSIMAFGISSCVSDVEEELIPVDLTCNTDNVSFSQDVLPIIQANCYQCHDAATSTAGVNLEGYDRIRAVAITGTLVGVIDHQPGFSQMPKNRAKLPICDIEVIKQWIEDGTPQN